MSIKLALCLRAEVMPLFLRQLLPKKFNFYNVGCLLSRCGYEAVEFGMNTYLHWD
jgi:hypothetical protein